MANTMTSAAIAAILASTGTAAAAQKTANAPAQASALQYCITYEPITGSRIGRTECKTKAQWADLGVDVDELLKKEK